MPSFHRNKPVLPLYLIIILLSLLGLKPGKTFAQEDNDSSVSYVNSMEYAFMMHEDTRWLLKADLVVKNEYVNMNPFKISFEHRIYKSLTANAAIDHVNMNMPGDYKYFLPLNFSVEPRWYYRLNKRMKEGNAASSLSDNYFAMGVSYTWLLNYNQVESPVDRRYVSYYAKWGIQRRYLKYGHIDLGIKAGMMDAAGKGFSPSLVLNTFVEMGLGFSKDKQAIDREKLCPFLRCYEADRFIVKTNLTDLVNLGIFLDQKWVELSPQVALEHKLGKSSFSLNASIGGTLGYAEFSEADKVLIDRYWIGEVSLEGRYYYNLQKSIRNGRSGNGLSANYLAAGGGYCITDGQYNDMIKETGPRLFLATGWQRLLSRHLYFDIQVGANYNFRPNRAGNVFEPMFQYGLGYRL
ncbi:MAG: hypothetical protein RBS55_00950 [Bacteroidales bacterium]|jgi:hypothetical protein|nr:hypothetical protein [Bacteroidales bacterium]